MQERISIDWAVRWGGKGGGVMEASRIRGNPRGGLGTMTTQDVASRNAIMRDTTSHRLMCWLSVPGEFCTGRLEEDIWDPLSFMEFASSEFGI